MNGRLFFIVGPTATGKSDLAADAAHELGGEIISADAFQIYRGLDVLSAKPDAQTLARAPHHLIGTVPLDAEMNAEKFRRAAMEIIGEIYSRGRLAMLVGGSGLYVKALTHGLAPLPGPDPELREKLNAMSLDELRSRLAELDPEAAREIDGKNRRRVMRALEICLLAGKPVSALREQWRPSDAQPPGHERGGVVCGVFVYRDREELYARINERVVRMFEKGVIEEVRAAGRVSGTASQMIGLREIRQLLEGKMSIPQCVAAIQQATRRYAKRQLTWFRRQTNFSSLNLSDLSHDEAVRWILQRAERSFASRDE